MPMIIHSAIVKPQSESTINEKLHLRVRMPTGIIGFEESRHYQLQPLQSQNPASIFWKLSCQDGQRLSFVLLFHDNQLGGELVIAPEDLQASITNLNLRLDEVTVFLLVTTEASTDQKPPLLTVNLKAPIILHSQSKQAWQVILSGSNYPIALPLNN